MVKKGSISSEIIEKYVQKRQNARAKTAISSWLKSNFNLESALQANDWLRRLGDFEGAYQVIAPDAYNFNRVQLSKLESRQYLVCARMLNLMGASHFALQIVKHLPLFDTTEENRIIANIYLANFDSKVALHFYQRAEKLDPNPESYPSRIARIEKCDALMGLGSGQEALECLKTIHYEPNERLLRGILLQAQGEYLARMGKSKSALTLFAEAEPYYSSEDRSIDGVFLLKWKGLAHIASKNLKQGTLELGKAISLLRRPDYRAEVWLDCLYWKRCVHQITPQEERLLQAYPGLSDHFTKRYGPLSSSYEINGNAKKGVIWISFPRRECKILGKACHNLPKKIELLGLLRRAYPFGINLTRLASVLWPDEVNSFLHLEGRIQQLIRQLRGQHDLEVFTKHREVFLSPKTARLIFVEVRAKNSVPLVFEDKKEVTFEDILSFYSIKRTQGRELIAQWLQEERIQSLKRGRNVFFKASFSN